MTSKDYKATPEQWATVCSGARWADDPSANRCILELRARVEALEAAQQPTVKALTVPPAPAGSLMEQVAAQIENGTACDREPLRLASAVIRKVAAAAQAKDNSRWDPSGCAQLVTWRMVAQWLEQEAGQ